MLVCHLYTSLPSSACLLFTMQSFLQYRSFGRHVEAQHERERARRATIKANNNAQNEESRIERPPAALEPRSSMSSTSTSSPSLSSVRSVDTIDFEKAHNNNLDGARDSVPHLQTNTNSISGEEPRATRTLSLRTTHDLELTSTGLGVALTGIQVRTRTTREGKGDPGLSQKVFVVGYEGEDDPLNPHNWSIAKRMLCTFFIAAISFAVGVASSIDSSTTSKAAADFGVSDVVESLAVGKTERFHSVVIWGANWSSQDFI